MYLQKNCNTAPYAYKIIKTLEKGFGVLKTREYINGLEATKTEDNILFDPKARVQVLQEESFSNALAYIVSEKKQQQTVYYNSPPLFKQRNSNNSIFFL